MKNDLTVNAHENNDICHINFSELRFDKFPIFTENSFFFNNEIHIWENSELFYSELGEPKNELSRSFNAVWTFAFEYNKKQYPQKECALDSIFCKKIHSELSRQINDIDIVILSKQLYPVSYSILNNVDTIVFFKDDLNGQDSILGEGEFSSYLNYSALGVIENNQISDCILISYYHTLMYMTPFRIFNITNKTITVLDIVADELTIETKINKSYEIRNKKFVLLNP